MNHSKKDETGIGFYGITYLHQSHGIISPLSEQFRLEECLTSHFGLHMVYDIKLYRYNIIFTSFINVNWMLLKIWEVDEILRLNLPYLPKYQVLFRIKSLPEDFIFKDFDIHIHAQF